MSETINTPEPTETDASNAAPETPQTGAVAPETDDAAKPAKPKRSKKREVLSWVLCIAGAVALALLIRAFIFEPITVDGESMVPTLQNGQHVLIEKVSRYFDGVERGSIVVTKYPNRNEVFVKRLIAKAGDTVEVREGYLYVNGEKQTEDYLKGLMMTYTYEKQTVPEGQIFVLGDNRNVSIDCHIFGPIESAMLVGRVFLVI